MHKILFVFLILFLSAAETYAYALKVYDEFGNRIGTLRKEGNSCQLYDMDDKEVDEPSVLLKNNSSKKILIQYPRTIYNENMNPIVYWDSGFYAYNGDYYPLKMHFIPANRYNMQVPNANQSNDNIKKNTYYVDTRYPKFRN